MTNSTSNSTLHCDVTCVKTEFASGLMITTVFFLFINMLGSSALRNFLQIRITSNEIVNIRVLKFSTVAGSRD